MQNEAPSLKVDQHIIERDADITALGLQVLSLTKAMTTLEKQRTQMLLDHGKHEEIVRLQNALDKTKDELSRVYQSTSWRLTAPIRKMMMLIRG